MDDLPSDILVHELGEFLYPFERFKLCRVSKILHQTYGVDTFPFNHHHYRTDCNFYIKHLQPIFHDGTVHLSNNGISNLSTLQLQYLKYFLIFNARLYRIYHSLLHRPSSRSPSPHSPSTSTAASHSISSRSIGSTPPRPSRSTSSRCVSPLSSRRRIRGHFPSSSSSRVPITSSLRSNPFLRHIHHHRPSTPPSAATTATASNHKLSPFLRALKCVHTVNLAKCASAFAINADHIRFLCDLLQCGFKVPRPARRRLSPRPMYKYRSLDDEAKWKEAQREQSRERGRVLRPFALNLSANNLNEKHIAMICRALLDRVQPLNVGALDLSWNHNISDECARVLFRCIGTKCPSLKALDLSYANITDTSCHVIYDFYRRFVLDREAATSPTMAAGIGTKTKRDRKRKRANVRGPSRNALHRIDLSFTRISENGLLTLDELFNEIPKSMKYIHNDFGPDVDTPNSLKPHRERLRSVLSPVESLQIEAPSKEHAATSTSFDDDSYKLAQFGRRRHSKAQSFEIVLKGCSFSPMHCRNYDRGSAVPKLQTTCCITVESGDIADGH